MFFMGWFLNITEMSLLPKFFLDEIPVKISTSFFPGKSQANFRIKLKIQIQTAMNSQNNLEMYNQVEGFTL